MDYLHHLHNALKEDGKSSDINPDEVLTYNESSEIRTSYNPVKNIKEKMRDYL